MKQATAPAASAPGPFRALAAVTLLAVLVVSCGDRHALSLEPTLGIEAEPSGDALRVTYQSQCLNRYRLEADERDDEIVVAFRAEHSAVMALAGRPARRRCRRLGGRHRCRW